MDTSYDWITMLVFSGLAVLFLQRSAAERRVDTIWHYLPPAAGCALANWFGNSGHDAAAIATIGATVAYVATVLKPWAKSD